MAEPDEPDSLPTQHWTAPDAALVPPPPGRFSDDTIEGLLGGASPPRGSGVWQPPTAEELQASFPQYEIRGVLGRGGMGAVYLGWQKSLDRLVAIKILPPGLDDGGGQGHYAERFQREAKAMARLKHPGIVAVYDAGATPEGLLYFVMDYVEGTDVQKLVAAQGRLAAEQALAITSHVLDALAYAHEHGIIHRDIKPANIMLDPEGGVHVADFGLAKSTAADTALLTGSQMAMGTPDFMAPETRLGMEQADHRADLYAVGVMLYQMLTGKLPHGRFEALSRVVPGLDRRLDRIMDRALQPERDARHSSALELRSELQPILTRTLARRASASGTSTSRSRTTLGIGLAAALLLLAGAAFYFGKAKLSQALPTSPSIASSPVAAVLEPGAIKLWDTPEKIPTDGGKTWEDGALRTDKRAATILNPASRDAIIRASIRTPFDSGDTEVALRKKEQDYYSLRINGSRKVVEVKLLHNNAARILKSWPLPREYPAGEWVRLELRAVGQELTALFDGQTLGTVRDATVMAPGGIQLGSSGQGFFRDIVYVPLDKPGTPPPEIATAATPAPVVTATAGAVPSTTLEPGAIQLWDTPAKIPGDGGKTWQDGALRLEGRAIATANPASRDAIL